MPLICFLTVQMYHPDHVLKQFWKKQHIPADPYPIVLPKNPQRGRLTVLFREFIDMWENRRNCVIEEQPEAVSRRDYMAWY